MRLMILGGDVKSSYIVYHALKQEYSDIYLILEKHVPRTVLLKKRIKKLGLKRVLGQLLFKLIIVPFLKKTSRKRFQEVMEKYSLDDTCVYENGKDVFRVESVNSRETIELIHKISPEMIIVNGTRIISEQVLKATDTVFVNMHAGITPKYRGVHGAYWALTENDEEHCGVTVHLVDAGIDTGGILYQKKIERDPKDNFFTYPLLQVAEGIKLELQVIEDFSNKRLKVQEVKLPSKLWSHPTMTEYLKNYGKGIK